MGRASAKTILVLALQLLAGVGALAESGSEFYAEGATLHAFLERAQAFNPQLKAYEQRYQAALHRIPQASSLPDPVLQVMHFVESVQTRTGPQENTIQLTQRLPWFGKLRNRESVVAEEAEALLFGFQAQQLRLARGVALAFFEYAYTREAIRLTRQTGDLLLKLEPVVESRVSAGADMNALLRLKVEIGKVTDRLQTLEQQREVQSARLVELLALPAGGLLPFPDWSEPEQLELDGASLARAVEMNHPELSKLERMVRSANARREVARLESFPDVSVGLNYIQIGDPVLNATAPDAGKDAWGLMLSVNLPIWRERTQSGRAEALEMQRAAESEREARQNELRAELSSSLAFLKDAQRRLTLYGEELLGLAEQAVENSRTSYEGGRAGFLEVIDSERTLLDLRLLYWRAVADAWQQRVVILTLTNQPVPTSF